MNNLVRNNPRRLRVDAIVFGFAAVIGLVLSGWFVSALSAQAAEPEGITATVYEGSTGDYSVKIVEMPSDRAGTTIYTTVTLCPKSKETCMLGASVPGKISGSRLLAGDDRWYPVSEVALKAPDEQRHSELTKLLDTCFAAVHKPEYLIYRSNIGHAP